MFQVLVIKLQNIQKNGRINKLRIAKSYSHLNGEEYLMVHHPDLLAEIKDVIESIDADQFKTKVSKEKTKQGKLVYSPRELNKEFERKFQEKSWKEHIIVYYMTDDEKIARQTMSLEKNEQKRIIDENDLTAYPGKNQTDFVKEKVAIEVQFGKYSFVAYDLFVKHMAFYTRNEINVGIEILPVKEMQKQMSTGPGCFEGEVYNIYRQSRGTPAVPLFIIGVDI